MLCYKDFVPAIIQQGGLFKPPEFASLQAALAEANEWIQREKISVLNIETVVLPNIHDKEEEGSEDVELSDSGEYVTTWHQFIRVWYEE